MRLLVILFLSSLIGVSEPLWKLPSQSLSPSYLPASTSTVSPGTWFLTKIQPGQDLKWPSQDELMQ